MTILHFLAPSIADVRTFIQIVESLAKIAALAIGGWWTWAAFIRNRLKYPRANIEHQATIWRDGGRLFIHLAVRIINTGAVLIRLEKGYAWIEQLTPLPEPVRTRLENNGDVVPEGRTDAEWVKLIRRDLPHDYCCDIEPGETDTIDFDFQIADSVSRVLIYSYVENQQKRVIGWNLNTIHHVLPTL
jgi:hypothetical protein